jgi:hypothetical protein
MVVVTFIIDVGWDQTQDIYASAWRGSVWMVLLFILVAYGGKYFGKVGSLGAALSQMILTVPAMLLFHYSTEQQCSASATSREPRT